MQNNKGSVNKRKWNSKPGTKENRSTYRGELEFQGGGNLVLLAYQWRSEFGNAVLRSVDVGCSIPTFLGLQAASAKDPPLCSG